MQAKLIAAILWYPFVIVILIANLALLGSMMRHSATASYFQHPSVGLAIAGAAGTGQILGAEIIPGDGRTLLLTSFLATHESPMTPFAHLFVELADQKHIDYRLAPAIAMCESNLGKRMPLKEAYNAWGIRCYTGQEDRCKQFSGWEHAISWVMNYLKTTYFDNGISDLRQIGAKWAPPSVENGYSWTNCVEKFIAEI